MIHTVSVWWLIWLRPPTYLWIAATGTTAYAQTPSTTPIELHSLVGRIEGLVNHGLALSDGAGNMLHPSAGARVFAFREGRPFLIPGKPVHLMVVRQPMGQACRVVPEGGDDQSDAQQGLVSCVAVSEGPPTMRDCFQVFTSGASFKLGRMAEGQWFPYADVTMDPVGSSRLHHRTLVQGKVLMESVTYFSEDRALAVLELLIAGTVGSGQRIRAVGDQEGLPIDLAVGEDRFYIVTTSRQYEHQAKATESVLEKRWAKLIGVGPLDTRAGRFPVTCHLLERSDESGVSRIWETWYAPGYGPIRMQGAAEGGMPSITVEVTEIQLRPR